MNNSLNIDAMKNELRKKGLTDEAVINELAAVKSSNGYLLKKKLPSGMYDKVNLMCRKYMDRLARFEMDYDFIIDKEKFTNTCICCLETVPILRSQVINHPVAPYWRVSDYEIGDFLTVKEVEDINKAREEFFAREIPLKSNVQMNIGLFYHNGRSYILLIWNHMCFDGGGFKMFWSDFCRNFTLYVNNGTAPVAFSTGSRDHSLIYRDMPEEKRKRAKKQLANVSPRIKTKFPFTKMQRGDGVIIASRKIDEKYFTQAKKYAKSKGATVTDLLLAVYIDSLGKIAGLDKNSPVSVACATDLRRYIKDLSDVGYTNHVSFIHCALKEKGESLDATLLAVKNKTAQLKRDEFMGLHGLPLLDFAYKAMPYWQAEGAVKLFYNNPLLSVSNVGEIVPEGFVLGEKGPFDAFVAGAAKNKPCAVMTALSINGMLSVSMCLRGNDKDREVLEKFFTEFENNIKSL